MPRKEICKNSISQASFWRACAKVCKDCIIRTAKMFAKCYSDILTIFNNISRETAQSSAQNVCKRLTLILLETNFSTC